MSDSLDKKGDPAEVKKNEVKERKGNLFQDLLKKATRQQSDITSNLVVFGDQRSGKSTLLASFGERKSHKDMKEYVLDYSYVEVKNRHNQDKDETIAYMNIWQIGDVAHVNLLPLAINTTSSGLSKTVYVITLNLAEPWNVLSRLETWLEAIKTASETCLNKLTPEQQQELKTKISKDIAFHVDQSIKERTSDKMLVTQEEKDKVKLDEKIPEINVGVPIIVVGCKTDLFANALLKTSDSDIKFELLEKEIREICFKYGAALIYTSQHRDDVPGISQKKMSNLEVFQDYVLYRLYNFGLPHVAKVVGTCEDYAIYIPSGYDRPELMKASTSNNPTDPAGGAGAGAGAAEGADPAAPAPEASESAESSAVTPRQKLAEYFKPPTTDHEKKQPEKVTDYDSQMFFDLVLKAQDLAAQQAAGGDAKSNFVASTITSILPMIEDKQKSRSTTPTGNAAGKEADQKVRAFLSSLLVSTRGGPSAKTRDGVQDVLNKASAAGSNGAAAPAGEKRSKSKGRSKSTSRKGGKKQS